jgi:succinoglycan biosynthesis protein ExoA
MVVSSSAEFPRQVASRPSTPGAEYISVVIPCYNEARFIGKALNNLADQYDHKFYEIIVVDGMSDDKTREVITQFKESHPGLSIRIVDNPARNIPKALNLGIAAARGDIILRMDAHAVPSHGYVRRCVDLVRKNNDSVIGSPCIVCPGAETLMARAIAIAVSHPFGIGDAKYRLKSGKATQEPVDTVAFGSFTKGLWQELGGFNEDLLTNEDYDFNYRVRARGGVVLLDRAEHCDYFARSTLFELASQYFRYGQWKARMLRLHPQSIRWRHFVAPLFVASLMLLGALGIVWPVAWLLLGLELSAYLGLGLLFGRQSGPGAVLLTLLLPVVFLTIHLSWGSSFFIGLLHPSR